MIGAGLFVTGLAAAGADWEPSFLLTYPEAVGKVNLDISVKMPDCNWYGNGFYMPFDLHLDFKAPIGGLPFTLGAGLGLGGGSYTYGPYTRFALGFTPAFRIAYHFNWGVKGLDTYAFSMAGMHVNFWIYEDDDTAGHNKILDLHEGGIWMSWVNVGVRYFFTDSFGVFAEAGGGGLNYPWGMNLGISLKW